MLHHNNIFLHEIALHADHAPADFKAPYQVERLHLTQAQATTAACIDPITECINSAHCLMDAFLSMDIDSLQAVPVSTYVRVSYALFVLAKLHVSANSPTSKLREYIDRESLKVGLYLDAAVACLGKVVKQKACKVPSMFLRLLIKFQTWYTYREAQLQTAKETNRIPVQMTNLHLPYDQKNTVATGSLNHSEYMLAGFYPFAAASQNLEQLDSSSAAQQVPVQPPNWNPQPQAPFKNLHGNPDNANNLQESFDPVAVGFHSSVNSDVDQLDLANEFRYTPIAAFDDRMDLDLDFSLFGSTSNMGGELDAWALPTSYVGNVRNEQIPNDEYSRFQT
jgi:hypothetical protein